jgi:hypothetical protein
MTLDQFIPGVRVFLVLPDKTKIYGTAGNGYVSDEVVKLVRFDNNMVAKITEESAQLFQMEPLN